MCVLTVLCAYVLCAYVRKRLETQGLDSDLMDRGKSIQDLVEETTRKVIELEQMDVVGNTDVAAALKAEIATMQVCVSLHEQVMKSSRR